jgi:hypothetical protein
MLSEHQLETIEKTFPDGCIALWIVKKSEKKPKAATKKGMKFGVYVFNPQNNSDINDVLRLIMGDTQDGLE